MVNDNLGKMAKRNLGVLAKEIDKRLGRYWDEEVGQRFGFGKTQKELVRKMLLHAKEHNLRSAKRVRAAFVIYGYLLGKNSRTQELKNSKNQNEVEMERVWRVAEGVEIIHTALLMHDDFMDQDKVRRGRPTTQEFFGAKNSHYGNSMAVSVGDAVLCLGLERVLAAGLDGETTQKVMRQLLRGITQTAFGQAYDVSLGKILSVTDPTSLKRATFGAEATRGRGYAGQGLRGAEEKVMSLHRAKTALYTYENPLLMGGALAGLTEPVLKILSEYSAQGGIAFQLQDDVLGVYGDGAKTGKSTDSDLLQGKVTLLMVKVLEKGTEEQIRTVMKVWGRGAAEEGDIQKAKEAIKASGAYAYSVKVAREMAEMAARTAARLRSFGLNAEAIDYLEGIERYMVGREV